MAFQTPITIKHALDAIQRQEYVLPAIQREFTWKPHQIAGLFDSLMQGYPIGSLLFWKVQAERTADYAWYGVMRDYHERKNRHCPVLDVPERPIVAILDGQQRLTSLNIGLRGSHAEKAPRKWWNNPHAFPVKRLYLNLLGLAPENEQGFKYDLRFLTEKQAARRGDGHLWFKVADLYDFKEDFDVILALQGLGLGNDQQAARLLHLLYRVVHKDRVLPYFEESEQNLDKVLNIFIRVNSAGTPLSYSDLLLSIATAQWTGLDARQAIHGLVDELNGTRQGFQVSKDLVLKAGLMLSDIPSVAFRVTNFNSRNMRTLEENWQGIGAALRLAVELLASFGFSRQTLSADSVIIPVAYYLYKRALGPSYLTSTQHAEDRESVRGWVCRSLVKSGVWGSGLDTLLLGLRTALEPAPGLGRFPVDEVEAAMARRGKRLRFTEDELQDLVDSSDGDKRTFALLGLLYPFVDLNNVFHLDHIFPRSRFTAAKLRRAGVAEGDIEELRDKANRLANLQLLEGAVNTSKQDKLPADWLEARFPTAGARLNYCELHDLGEVPPSIVDFDGFYTRRRERLLARLREVLEPPASAMSNDNDEPVSSVVHEVVVMEASTDPGEVPGDESAPGRASERAASAVVEAAAGVTDTTPSRGRGHFVADAELKTHLVVVSIEGSLRASKKAVNEAIWGAGFHTPTQYYQRATAEGDGAVAYYRVPASERAAKVLVELLASVSTVTARVQVLSTPEQPGISWFYGLISAIEARRPAELRAMRKRVHGYQAWAPAAASWGIHYEVMRRAEGPPSVEIHIEQAAEAERVRPLLERWALSLRPAFDGATLEFDPTWARSKGRLGRLRLTLPAESSAAEVVDGFCKLVDLTKREIWPEIYAEAALEPGAEGAR